jgi:hypothetical protein
MIRESWLVRAMRLQAEHEAKETVEEAREDTVGGLGDAAAGAGLVCEVGDSAAAVAWREVEGIAGAQCSGSAVVFRLP